MSVQGYGCLYLYPCLSHFISLFLSLCSPHSLFFSIFFFTSSLHLYIYFYLTRSLRLYRSLSLSLALSLSLSMYCICILNCLSLFPLSISIPPSLSPSLSLSLSLSPLSLSPPVLYQSPDDFHILRFILVPVPSARVSLSCLY